MSKPETKQPPEWAESITHLMRIIVRREGGDPDKLLPLDETTDAVSQSPAVKELVEAATLAAEYPFTSDDVVRLQSALEPFKDSTGGG